VAGAAIAPRPGLLDKPVFTLARRKGLEDYLRWLSSEICFRMERGQKKWLSGFSSGRATKRIICAD
jgi:hypothetical protein